MEILATVDIVEEMIAREREEEFWETYFKEISREISVSVGGSK